jgi:hypothetical protein
MLGGGLWLALSAVLGWAGVGAGWAGDGGRDGGRDWDGTSGRGTGESLAFVAAAASAALIHRKFPLLKAKEETTTEG